jgi:uncharacterized membrane protein YdbT with pleckstrin-like domain
MLASGERVLLDRRPHMRALLGPAFVLVAATAAALFAAGFVGRSGWSADIRWWMSLAIAGLWLVTVLHSTVRPFMVWWTTLFVITDRRVLYRSGVFTRTGIDIPLDRINSVEFHHDLVDRVVGTGTLTIESASQDPLEFADIPNVEQVHALLYGEVFDAP